MRRYAAQAAGQTIAPLCDNGMKVLLQLTRRYSSPSTKGADISSIVGSAENRASRDQHMGAGIHQFSGVVGHHAAIDFDLDRAVPDHRRDFFNLFDGRGNEALSAEAG